MKTILPKRFATLLVWMFLSCYLEPLSDQLAELDLAGSWEVRLDPDDTGISERWYTKPFEGSVYLPGSIQSQGLGEDVELDTVWTGMIVDQSYFEDDRYAPYRKVGNIKVPFWLQPEKVFTGPVWYQREVVIPDAWRHKRVRLLIERAHWTTTLWLDGQELGSQDSLSTPHVYDIPAEVSPGKHSLVVRVDNRVHLNVGPNSHSVSDHTQSNWNGMVGDLKLSASDPVWLEDVRIYPDVSGRKLGVKIMLGNGSGEEVSAQLRFLVSDPDGRKLSSFEKRIHIETAMETLELDLNLGESVRTWDEFHPALYSLRVEMNGNEGSEDVCETGFGMRNVGVKGTRMTLNGRPTFMRGTLECAIFPLTGYPPTDLDDWRKIIGTCKEYGLNHMRFHSWCPPEAAFSVADELGFYLQVECGSWANQGASIGDGGALDQWLYEEASRITRAYGNHPSFIMMAYGNEPAGRRHEEFLSEWCDYWREHEPRILHTSGAGWPLIEASDFHSSPDPRLQGWGQGLQSIINAQAPNTRFDFRSFVAKHPDKPTISHEIGQWCVYSDFDEISQYTGVLKPKNFEIFRDFLQASGMGEQAHDFLMASGKLQALCYKADIEAALRTPGFGGFQLLDLHDFPGQGTALVGVLNPFWESKGYIHGEEHRRYCGPCVPLARMDKMVWTRDETFIADVEVCHFGENDLVSGQVTWSLVDAAGLVVDEGALKVKEIKSGGTTQVGSIQGSLKKVKTAGKLVLHVNIPEAKAENTWDIWVYPSAQNSSLPAKIHVAANLDADAVKTLEDGGSVFLMIPPDRVDTDVALGFSSIFWNTAWTQGQAPHTLGVLCDPEHPALEQFPTDFHSSWQWWDLIRHAATMEMDAFPAGLRPTVQIVPDWFHPKRLGLVFEARMGQGRLLVTSIDLDTRLQERPVARQMRTSLLSYMSSEAFQPSESLTASQVRSLFKSNSKD